MNRHRITVTFTVDYPSVIGTHIDAIVAGISESGLDHSSIRITIGPDDIGALVDGWASSVGHIAPDDPELPERITRLEEHLNSDQAPDPRQDALAKVAELMERWGVVASYAKVWAERLDNAGLLKYEP